MIRITVTSHHDAPLATAIVAQFDETGGDIGRAESNQLVLPDPERTISRVHARVVFRGGGYAIVDQGSNPIVVNGQTLGKGKEAPLKPGDRVQIGGYTLQVESGQAPGRASAADPFADFAGLAQPRTGAPGAGSSASGLLAALAPAPSASLPPPSTPHRGSGIPDDWDPFATAPLNNPVPMAKPSAGAHALGLDLGAGAPAPLIPDFPGAGGGGTAESLDQLFGLGGGAGGSNPLANSILDQPLAAPNMASHADPMQSLRKATPGVAQAAPDQLSELNRPFLPPVTTARPAAPPAVIPPPPIPPVAPPLSGAVLSWNDGAADGRTIIRAGAKIGGGASPSQPAPQAAPQPVEPPVQPRPMAQAIPPREPAPAHVAAAAPAVQASDSALLAALREGLGVPDLALPPVTPELMRLLGQLLHEAARGTVDLLVARAALKREVRAEVTMIVAKENNPLKFSPTPEVALAHLLGPPTRGFTAPPKAMRDAYDDLRAHQLAFLAGMRAALEGLLQRFDPTALEGRLTQKSMLASLLPAARKAQLWSVFQQEYQQIASEVADDFHQVFGREFLRAYEAQLDALQDGPR